jgi:predicted component of type VI protein secretion system
MLPLVVHIERPSGGPTITRVFHESPVRLGRSPFASLRLREPFVSEWQAVVRFHSERTTYLDLGSRNPTQVEGRAIQRNVEIEIDHGTDIRIGPLKLRFERVAAPREPAEPIAAEDTAFVPEQLLANDRLASTVILDAAPPLAAASAPRPSGPRPPPPLAPVSARPPPLPAADLPLLAAAEREFERTRSAFLGSVEREIEATPAARRADRIRALHAEYPRLGDEPAFRHWAQAAGVQLGQVDVEHWLARLCGRPSLGRPEREEVAVTMERAGQLLELFASSFIESRRAHQRARKKLGLEAESGDYTQVKNVLEQSEDPHAVLAYLLESNQLAQARSQELRRALGDFAMHQIALLSAVVEGARAMLGQLAPHALEAAPEHIDHAAVLDSEQHVAGLWPFAAKKLWRRLVVRHHDLLHADHFARELFGREFTRRYHAIADSATHVQTGERT